MDRIKVKINRPFKKAKVIQNEELIEEIIDDIASAFEEEEEEEIIEVYEAEPEPEPEPEPFVPEYVQYYRITNLDKPVQINLDNIQKVKLEGEDLHNIVETAYDNGYIAGKKDTTKLMNAEIVKYNQFLNRIDSVVEELTDEYRSSIKKFEDTLVDLSIMVAQHILEHEIAEKPKTVVEQTRKALRAVDQEIIYKIKVNENDRKILEHSRSELFTDSSKTSHIMIVADSSVNQGSCILETSSGNIDARVQTQLEKLRASLKETIKAEEMNEKIEEENSEIENAEE